MVISLLVCLLASTASTVGGFTSINSAHRPTERISLNLGVEGVPIESMQARTEFFLWFFGASGAAGLARNAFPRMYNSVMEIQGLKDSVDDSTFKTVETVGLSPLCGYPRDIAKADIRKIINNPLNIEQIAKKYPVENNLWSAKGYITFKAFKEANAKADPLAVRGVFDCFAQSTDVCNPEIAQQKLDSYKADLGNFKTDLLKSKLVGYAAIVVLLGLLGLADVEAYTLAYTGWFPEWPGGRAWLQGGLFDPDTGLLHIPDYWI